MKNPWRDLFDVQRSAIARGPLELPPRERRLSVLLCAIALPAPSTRALRGVPRGSGMILEVDGQIVAASRDKDGALDAAVAGVHAPWLPRGVEHHREDVGLSVPRLALHRHRRSAGRARRASARAANESVGDQPRQGVTHRASTAARARTLSAARHGDRRLPDRALTRRGRRARAPAVPARLQASRPASRTAPARAGCGSVARNDSAHVGDLEAFVHLDPLERAHRAQHLEAPIGDLRGARVVPPELGSGRARARSRRRSSRGNTCSRGIRARRTRRHGGIRRRSRRSAEARAAPESAAAPRAMHRPPACSSPPSPRSDGSCASAAKPRPVRLGHSRPQRCSSDAID